MTNHAYTRVMWLYDYRHHTVKFDEIERAMIWEMARQAGRPGGKKVYLFFPAQKAATRRSRHIAISDFLFDTPPDSGYV